VFNVYIEGAAVLTHFDIYAAAGGRNLPLTRVFTNAVADGQLEIFFQPLVDNARTSGIQVRKIDDLYSDDDGIPDWWRLAYFDRATGGASDLSRGSDDADGDGATNYEEFRAGTNPLDASSVFRIQEFRRAGDEFELIWLARSNKLYQIERGELHDSASWDELGALIPGVEGVVTQSVSGSPGGSHFFRIRVE
jgi:hypothetical protein